MRKPRYIAAILCAIPSSIVGGTESVGGKDIPNILDDGADDFLCWKQQPIPPNNLI
jgi:hypothetical protein